MNRFPCEYICTCKREMSLNNWRNVIDFFLLGYRTNGVCGICLGEINPLFAGRIKPTTDLNVDNSEEGK